MSSPEVQREDLSAAVAARRELGADSEREVVEAFLDRVGTAIDARVDQRLAQQRRERRGSSASRGSIPLALGSMGIGIAATGAASGLDDGEPVAIIIWLVIGAINIAHALRS
ncbi:MAG TPA: hypothetical protein VHF51_03350 [Solirubrobacteraceae bacterium]|nr:hypothetical protein [Solirubrobacteraceae bacterium]